MLEKLKPYKMDRKEWIIVVVATMWFGTSLGWIAWFLPLLLPDILHLIGWISYTVIIVVVAFGFPCGFVGGPVFIWATLTDARELNRKGRFKNV